MPSLFYNKGAQFVIPEDRVGKPYEDTGTTLPGEDSGTGRRRFR